MLSSNIQLIDEIEAKSKNELIDKILIDSEHYLRGSQLIELNKTLNKHFNEYDILLKNDIELHENYKAENSVILDEFIKNKRIEGLSERTLVAYEVNNKAFLDFVNKHVSDVTTDDIREYLLFKENTCSKVTLNNIKRFLSAFFTVLDEENIIVNNPVKRVKTIKIPKRNKKPFTEAEIESMRLEIASQKESTYLQSYLKLRNIVLFELLLSSGIRVSECSNIKKEDIDLVNKQFRVIGKGDKERTCYFNEKTKIYLTKLLNMPYKTANNDIKYSPYLFVGKTGNKISKSGIERIIRNIGKNKGVKAHPHKFRRTFATRLLRRDVPIEQIKELLGHNNLDTTLTYAITDKESVKMNHSKFI